MTWLMQTYFFFRVSFTNVAEDVMDVVKNVSWEIGDAVFHQPHKPYDGVFYIGNFTNLDVSRYYRYIWWTNRHVYYGVTEGPPVLSHFNYAAARNMTVVVPSQYVKWELEHAGIPVAEVIPHGIDVRAIRSADPRVWRNAFGDRTVVLYVAHRHIRKGFRELIKAWRMTKASRDPNVLLALHTGREPHESEDGYRIPEGGNVVITENFLKLGRESLYGLYRAADVYVHGALCEGFGIPIVEAMAAGKPVICIDAGPMNEHVKDKRALVRVEGEVIHNYRGLATFRLNVPDLKDYAEKLDAVIYDKSLREELGAENAEAAERYEKSVVYSRFTKWVG
jgi:glycosyltransferase involved in cell wall biosynthesis